MALYGALALGTCCDGLVLELELSAFPLAEETGAGLSAFPLAEETSTPGSCFPREP